MDDTTSPSSRIQNEIMRDIASREHLLRLQMSLEDFRQLFPDIDLARDERRNSVNGADRSFGEKLLGSRQVLAGPEQSSHWFFTFEAGVLVFYEINAEVECTGSAYWELSRLYESLVPALSKIYGPGKAVHSLKDFGDFMAEELPSDGYPCDRYVIAAHHGWNDRARDVGLSFARVWSGKLFFQIRAVTRGV